MRGMEIDYKRDLSKSYMVLSGENRNWQDFELMMAGENDIFGLLDVYCMEENDKKYYYYDISGKQSLDVYLQKNGVKREFLQKLVEQIKKVTAAAQDYLLDENEIMLYEDMIFVDSDGNISFTYLPGNERDVVTSFREFIEASLPKANRHNRDEMEYVYGIYQKTLEDNFSLESVFDDDVAYDEPVASQLVGENADYGYSNMNFQNARHYDAAKRSKAANEKCELPGDEMRDISVPANDVRVNKSEIAHASEEKPRKRKAKIRTKVKFDEEELPRESEDKKRQKWREKKRQKISKAKPAKEKKPSKSLKLLGKLVMGERKEEDEEYEEDLYEEEKNAYMYTAPKQDDINEFENCVHPTVFMNIEQGRERGLFQYLGCGNEKDFAADKDVLYIGKNGGNADVVLVGATVSRVHAKVTRKDDGYYIEDLNSKNGTYINEKQLCYKQKMRLSLGDRVRFGEEGYRFT